MTLPSPKDQSAESILITVRSLFIVLSVFIIGLSLPSLIRIRSISDITELHILLLLYALLTLLTGILIHNDNAIVPSVFISVFISVILGSIIINRTSDWLILFNKQKVLTSIIGLVMLLSFVMNCVCAGMMLNDGIHAWNAWKTYNKRHDIAFPVV